MVPTALATRNSALTGSAPYRVVPDISMDADPGTGFLVGETQRFPNGTYYDQYRIGGTSVSSPLFAGTVAIADELAGSPLGFLDPAIYAVDKSAPSTVYDAVPAPPQDQARVDYANGITTSKGLDPNMKHMSDVINPPDFLTGAMSNLSGQAADPFKIPPGTATEHPKAP